MILVDILNRNHWSSPDNAVAVVAVDHDCDYDDDSSYDTDDYGGGGGSGGDAEVNFHRDNIDSFHPYAVVADRDALLELVFLVFDDKTGKRSILPTPYQRRNSQEQHNYPPVQPYHVIGKIITCRIVGSFMKGSDGHEHKAQREKKHGRDSSQCWRQWG